MTSRAGFEVGPLLWVKQGIDRALQSGVQALAGCTRDSADEMLAAMATSRLHLHQAVGALQILGLEGVTAVARELEALLAELERGPARRGEAALTLAQSAFHGLRAYLDDLAAGMPHLPLRLMPIYSRLVCERGMAEPHPADLYFPDLSLRPPLSTPAGLQPEEVRQTVQEQRARYQRGLLALLRNERSGIGEMRSALETIELAEAPEQRAFWWVARAFLDALAHQSLPGGESEVLVKRLCNRIEQQIRLLSEGAHSVGERLMREALYFVARAQPASEHLQQVQETYALAATLPAEALASLDEETARTRALGRGFVARAKEAWDSFVSGQPAELDTFRDSAAALRKHAAGLQGAAFASLLERIAAVGETLAQDPSRMSEALALEQATALLFAADVLADSGASAEEFAHRSELLCKRLEDGIDGKLLRTAPGDPVLDEFSRRAQENLIAEQTVAESQARLRSVEELLDRFFRDPGDRAQLAALAGPLEQIDSALSLLGEPRSRDVLAECIEQIRQFSASDFVPLQPQFDRACGQLAEKLVALGIYLQGLALGSADWDQAMRPIGRKGQDLEVPFAITASDNAMPVIDVPKPPLPQQPAEQEAWVDIGMQRVSAGLFTLYSGEARMHMAALEEEQDTLNTHGVISDAMLKAVHTLAEIAATVQLADIRSLALALEQALGALALSQLSSEEQMLIGEAIDALEQMVMRSLELTQPGAAHALVARLERLAGTAKSAQPPPDGLGPVEKQADPLAEQASEPLLSPGPQLAALRDTVVELSANLARLGEQLREMEIRAEPRFLSAEETAAAGRDPLELDRFTRVQELSRRMAALVKNVHSVQTDLVAILSEPDAAAGGDGLTRIVTHDL